MLITNTTEFPRRFPKNLEIAKFTILTVDDADDVQPIHPLAADVVQQVANKIEFDRDEFREIVGLGIQKEQPSINTLEELDKNVAKANQEYQENASTGGDPHDIIQVTPLEGATNEIWFATLEKTQNPDTARPL